MKAKIVILSVLLLGVGCKSKAQIKKVAERKAAVTVETPYLSGKIKLKEKELYPIFFDFDDAIPSNESVELLERNLALILKHPKWKMVFEGHCDERGTTAYNLGLAQRRADRVIDYYFIREIEAARMESMSWGCEMPFCQEHTEECWAMNRRVQIRVSEK